MQVFKCLPVPVQSYPEALQGHPGVCVGAGGGCQRETSKPFKEKHSGNVSFICSWMRQTGTTGDMKEQRHEPVPVPVPVCAGLTEDGGRRRRGSVHLRSGAPECARP